MAEKNQYGANIRPQHKLTNEEGKEVKNFLRRIITSLLLLNPISHGVFDRDNIMGGVLKTHSLKPDLALSDHHDNHTM